MFISKKNYLNIILIGLVTLGLVDNKLSLFKRNTVRRGGFTSYVAKDNNRGIYARIDIPDTFNPLIVASISHNYQYLDMNYFEIENDIISGDKLLNVKYELIYVKDDKMIVLLSLDSSFHSDKYWVSNEAIESKYIKAPISYTYEDVDEIITENRFSLTLVSGDKRYTLLDNFEVILSAIA